MRCIRQAIDRRAMAGQVNLVPYSHDRNVRREARRDVFIGTRRATACIEHVHDDIGAVDRRPSALDTDALHLVAGIGGIANAGRVDHIDRDTFELNGFCHLVARGAGNRRDDRHVRACQGIQQ